MELLAPAGNFDKLVTAVHFGADAVYFAGKQLGLRAFAGNFTDEEIEKAMLFLHENGKKGYITLNIVAKDIDFENLDPYLAHLEKCKVDGLIVSDVGLIYYIRKNFPSLNVHVSTQANVNNSQSAKFYSDMGVTRIVLARELSLNDIKNIRKNLPESVEIEAFVHGAMCISYSGRCLLSNYLTGRDSNRGACVQACRWKYFIREESRDDEYEIQEDERGTYILNSKDLCMIEHIKELEEAGIASLKIEGRMKSDYYVASVVNAYRRAIDGKNDMKTLLDELEKTSHRRYTTGFYFGSDDKEHLETSMPVQTAVFVAKVVEEEKNGYAKVEMRNRFKKGDTLEILSPSDNFGKTITIDEILTEKGEEIDDCKRVQEIVSISTPFHLQKGDILRVNKSSEN
jgi:putative protease